MPKMDSDKMPSMKIEGDLQAPSHEVEAPAPVIKDAGEMDSDVAMPLVPKSGIKVVATRKGFYNQLRVKEGDEFIIKDFSKIGEWMKCVDPALERKRVEFYKNKKARS